MEELQIEPKFLQVKVYHRRHRDPSHKRPQAFWKDGWHMTTFELGEILETQASRASALSNGADATLKALVTSVPRLLKAARAREEKLNKNSEHGYADEVPAYDLIRATFPGCMVQVAPILATLGLNVPNEDGIDADKIWLQVGMEVLETSGATTMTGFATNCQCTTVHSVHQKVRN